MLEHPFAISFFHNTVTGNLKVISIYHDEAYARNTMIVRAISREVYMYTLYVYNPSTTTR